MCTGCLSSGAGLQCSTEHGLGHVWVYMDVLISIKWIQIYSSSINCFWSLSLRRESDNQCLGKTGVGQKGHITDKFTVRLVGKPQGDCSHTFSSRLISGVPSLDQEVERDQKLNKWEIRICQKCTIQKTAEKKYSWKFRKRTDPVLPLIPSIMRSSLWI